MVVKKVVIVRDLVSRSTTEARCLQAFLFAIQPYIPTGIDQPIRPIDSDISPLTRTLFLDLATGRVWSDGSWLTSCLWVVVSKHHCSPPSVRFPAGCEHDDAAAVTRERSVSMPNRTLSPRCHHGLRRAITKGHPVDSNLTEGMQQQCSRL